MASIRSSLIQKICLVSLLTFLTMATCIIGCATIVKSPEQASEATNITYDPYTKRSSITGMTLNLGDFPNITKVFLRGGYSENGKNDFIQLYVYHWSQTGWNFFDTANDITGTPLHVTQVDRSVVSGGNVEEHIAIDLPRDFLENHKTQGLDIKIQGTGGSLIVKVPPAYIMGFMQKYDSGIPK